MGAREMRLSSNITKRNGSAVYYARVARPLELVEARRRAGLPPAKDVWKSLGTRDPREAKRVGPLAVEVMARDQRAESHDACMIECK